MRTFNLLEKSIVSVAVLLVAYDACAAGGRQSMMPTTVTSSSRMPTMPTATLTTIGNPAVTSVSQPVEVTPIQKVVVPTPSPTPKPDPKPDDSEEKPEPKPVPECPDGGVKDSDYTVDNCMEDLKRCVNSGALQGGLSDLFNEDVRNSIFTGMKLCQSNVDKCIATVRVDCRNVYNEKNDVWLDFNSRVVQPEYYNFVLRKTGLTPFQAENTCLLLDRNTFGSSFSSVSDLDLVRAEYQQSVGAYNSQNYGMLVKDNPLGVNVNTSGYDAKRGHYARWDATNAECLLRVGAYNKNTAIKNSWLFGGVGNDNVAEVWKPAGTRFTCDKDLFGFSLLNDTKTAAVVGIVGGTVVGAGVGAGIGAAVYDSKKHAADQALSDPCEDESYRQTLGKQIESFSDRARLNNYLYTVAEYKEQEKKIVVEPLFAEGDTYYNMTQEQCQSIHNLFGRVKLYEDAVDKCEKNANNKEIAKRIKAQSLIAHSKVRIGANDNGKNVVFAGDIDCGDAGNLKDKDAEQYNTECMFIPLQLGFKRDDKKYNPICNHDGWCISLNEIKQEISMANKLIKEIEPSVDKNVVKNAKGVKQPSKAAEIGKGAAIGAATGAGVGGLATAITAFVERSNITCKVGDGLNSVALGKSHTIDTLKEFYVKWNLQLPDAISPTAEVVDVDSWDQACGQFNNKLYDCPDVQINLKRHGKYKLIPSACKISGNLCIRNYAVSASHGIR